MNEAKWALVKTLCNLDDNFIVTAPGDSQLNMIGRSLNVDVRKFSIKFEPNNTEDHQYPEYANSVASGTWKYNLEALKNKIDEKTKFLYLINPNWCIGQLLDEETVTSIIQIANEKNIQLVVDESFKEFPFPGREIHNFADYNESCPIISLNCANNYFGLTGMHFGWMVLYGEEECFENFIKGINFHRKVITSPDSILQNSIAICFDTVDKVI